MVYVGQLPNGTFEDEEVLKLAEPFGKVKKYFLNPIKREVTRLAPTECSASGPPQ